MNKKLTKKLMEKYAIKIDSQSIDSLALSRPLTLYTIVSESLKINWSGVGSNWLNKYKKELLQVISLVET